MYHILNKWEIPICEENKKSKTYTLETIFILHTYHRANKKKINKHYTKTKYEQ